ncbi:MAG: glycoside hydrolase family 3 N-terminal domain-containing protein [Vicinamibacterales bacterium]
MQRIIAVFAVLAILTTTPTAQSPAPLDRDATLWVEATLKKLSLDELVGQMVFASISSTYLSTDTKEYDDLVRLVHEAHVGGILTFGGTEAVPQVMLNPTYGAVILGQPLELASLFNRLQSISALPLLTAADFEWGAGMRLNGATKFPRAMAFGAAGDPALAYEAGKITAQESRGLGVHVDFGPVADVNNNARNPVINVRSFGEDPASVGTMVASWVRGLQDGGMLATLKHFPGHGDTDVDSHLGLPIIAQPRARLDAMELPPFKAGIAAHANGVMVAHIELPAIDKDSGPATFSPIVIGELLRKDLGFNGLVYSDSMKMAAIARIAGPGEAAVKAVHAGIDVVLDSPDPLAAVRAIKAAVEAGQIPRARIEASVRRLLEAKARLGLHRTRTVNLEAVPLVVGGRKNEAVAQAVADRAITLIKDARSQVPLRAPRTASVLYLSVLDYPSGWRIGAPSRTLIPELRQRWPALEAVEVSDRTTPSELDLVETMAAKYDVVIAGVFVRAASASGRLDLAPEVAKLLDNLARASERRSQPLLSVFFGNPYAAMSSPDLPAMLLTYDFSDVAERAAAKAIAGEIPIGGKLPVALPGLFPLGHGLIRGQ